MRSFEYVRATSVAEATAAAAHPDAVFIAGGTNLLDLMKGNVVRPGRLVDINHIDGLGAIDWQSNGDVRVGTLVPNSDLAHDARFARTFPAVAEALLSGASAQLRNAATCGGNVLQRSRCQYFYDVASACNRRKPGSGCDARGGITRTHAILGWSDACIATHPSDFCVPLTALGAVVEIAGVNGSREVPIDAFHLLPGKTPGKETVLDAGEMIVALRIPADAAEFAANSRYVKLRERTSYAFAVVSAAAALRLDGKTIIDARLALGSVAAKPWRAHQAEEALKGQTIASAAFETAATAALAEAKPAGDNGYKIELAHRIIVRAFKLAAAGTPARVANLPGSVFAAKEVAYG